MNTWKYLVFLAVAGFLALTLAGCPSDRPDLIVDLIADGEPTVTESGDVEVPLTVVVKNQGTASAGIFKVAVFYTLDDNTFVIPFTVPSQNDIWYPFAASLAPDDTVTFEGIITFAFVRGETVAVAAEADSDSGDEFLPAYARVNESNELNNISTAIDVDVP